MSSTTIVAGDIGILRDTDSSEQSNTVVLSERQRNIRIASGSQVTQPRIFTSASLERHYSSRKTGQQLKTSIPWERPHTEHSPQCASQQNHQLFIKADYRLKESPNRSTFCEQCSQFRISLASFIKHPGYDAGYRLDRPAVSIGKLIELRDRLNRCLLCRLIFTAFLGGPLKNALIRENPASLSENIGGIQVSGTWVNALGPKDEQCLRSSALFLILWFNAPMTESTDHKLVIRAISPVIPRYPHFGRLVEAPFLDLSLVKSWLKQCERHHGRCNFVTGSDARPFRFFTVIDVEKSCIVEIAGSCRYLALSYVWGRRPQLKLTTKNIKELSRNGGLLSQKEPHLSNGGPQLRWEYHGVSKVVLDAMKLTKDLGERYLWVDANCIIQDNLRVKRQCIEDMDLIYTRAVLTIIAASGTGADDPLPGITSERHSKQFFNGVSRSFGLSAHFDYKDHLNGSVYSQRAWT